MMAVISEITLLCALLKYCNIKLHYWFACVILGCPCHHSRVCCFDFFFQYSHAVLQPRRRHGPCGASRGPRFLEGFRSSLNLTQKSLAGAEREAYRKQYRVQPPIVTPATWNTKHILVTWYFHCTRIAARSARAAAPVDRRASG
jgi:hypothetical protein